MVNPIYESGVGDIRTRGKKTAMIVALIKFPPKLYHYLTLEEQLKTKQN
jgi:hypothetical protein